MLLQMFDDIDVDGDGSISRRELRQYMDNCSDPTLTRMLLASRVDLFAVFDALDKNGDNKISLPEARPTAQTLPSLP